jgi:hypothetical protein
VYDKPKKEGVQGMALHQTLHHMKDLLSKITHDLHKAEGGNKAASQRVRTNTVRLEKVAKAFRKESIASEKLNKGTKKTAKKSAAKPKAKAAHKAKPASKMKAKSKTASARPRALSLRKPTAKLPLRRPSFR